MDFDHPDSHQRRSPIERAESYKHDDKFNGDDWKVRQTEEPKKSKAEGQFQKTEAPAYYQVNQRFGIG
jgi:hypothetical protein